MMKGGNKAGESGQPSKSIHLFETENARIV